jgi:hypothetical protein
MKKYKLLILILLTFVNFINSQDKESPKKGKIYFLRSTGLVGSAGAFKTYIDGELVCKLNNKKYSIHNVTIGKHECFVLFGGLKLNEKAEKCEIQVEPDKITYVQFF